MSTSRAAILAAMFGLLAAPAVRAASFNVPDGATDSTQKQVSGTDVGTVGVGATLQISPATNNPTISWNGPSTNLVITNSGTIQSTFAGQRAINASGSNDNRSILLTNNAGALITSPDDAFRINVNPTGGAIRVDNAGTILSQSGQALDFDAAASGAATITINNLAGGVIRSNGQDAIRPGQGAVINNAGTIFSTGAAGSSYDGIDFQAKTGTVNNQAGGVISGLRHGITTDTGVVVNNALGATITGRNGSGVGSDGTGTVTNFGTITGAYDGSGRGDGDGVDIDLAATIVNHGTIQGTGAAGFDSGNRANNSEGISIGGGSIRNDGTIQSVGNAIVVNNDSNPDNSRSGVAATIINNDVGGMIVGQNGYAIRLENKTGTAKDNDTIVNYGTIIGNGAIPDPNAIILRGDGTPDPGSVGTLNGVTYTGTGSARFIRGDGAAIQMGEGNDILTNYGTIIGNNGRAISLEGGNDILNIATGSTITGRIDGGVGTDTINLIGTGTGTLSNVINFEVLNVQGGRWSLIDDQSYSSGVTIASGALLQVGNGATAGSLTANVVDNGTLAFNRTDGLTFSGAISGSGGVQLLGTGTTTLAGVNTYTGGTTIAAGTLVGTTTSFGTGAIVDNAALVISQSGDGTLSNAISGSGSVTKGGASAVQLTATNTYTGGTTIAAGTLVGSTTSFGTGAIVDNGTLALVQQSDGTLANAISGTGSLTKAGAGRVNLTGDSTLSGPTIVQQGLLSVNGSLAGSAVTVQNGAALGGTGTVGGLVAQSGSTVAPGNSIGTLNVAGNMSFAAGSTYQVEVNGAGQSDRIAATGATTLNGGTVQVLAQAGSYDPRRQYVILTSAGGVGGRFAGVSSNFAFLTPTLRYQPTEVDLTLTRNDIAFSAVARNRNQAAAADTVQAAGPGSGVYARTVGLTTPEAQTAFQALSGDVHASAAGAAFETAFFVRETILDRLRRGAAEGADYGALPATYTADLPGRTAPPTLVPARILDPRVFGLWAQGFGAFGRTDTDGNAAGATRQTAGFAAGADLRLDNGFRVGVAAGYSRTILDTTGRLQSGQIESGFGAVYGGTEFGPVALRLGAVYSGNDLRTRRSVIFPGVSEADTARYGGATTQGFGELGYRIALGNTGPAGLITKGVAPASSSSSYIEPFVGVAYVNIGSDRFTETGGVAALRGFARDNGIGTATLGLRAQTTFDLGLGAPVTAYGLLGYRRAFGDVVPTALLAFDTGPSFVTAGLPIDRDALVASAGLDLQVSANATIGVAYTGQVGARAENHAAKGNFTYRW